jgi:hypothetical protein
MRQRDKTTWYKADPAYNEFIRRKMKKADERDRAKDHADPSRLLKPSG